MVSAIVLFYRLFLFLMILFLTIFISIRIRRYPKNLRKLMLLAAIFSGIGAFGRLIDVLVLFISIPLAYEIHLITHVVSIGGVIWVFISLMLNLERYYIPLTSISHAEEKRKPGASYIVLSSNTIQDVVEFLQNIDGPVLLLTRYPNLYGNENIKKIWITTADSKGVSPTALHVLQDIAIRFASENNGATIVVDCLEYLVLYNGFKSVFKFLVTLKDHLMTRGATLIIFADPTALEESQVALLKREFSPL